MSLRLLPPLPTGGTTGADHADPGVCPVHTSVMLAPGEPCTVCHQGILDRVRALPISPQPPLERLPPDGATVRKPVGANFPAHRPSVPMQVEEELEPPVEISFEPIEPQGHASAGHYM